jgi:hypothetical protein
MDIIKLNVSEMDSVIFFRWKLIGHNRKNYGGNCIVSAGAIFETFLFLEVNSILTEFF